MFLFINIVLLYSVCLVYMNLSGLIQMTDWLIDWLIDWLSDRSIDRSIDWLIGHFRYESETDNQTYETITKRKQTGNTGS